MSTVLPGVRGLARRLLRMHAADGAADSVARGAEAVLELLGERIRPLLGASGYQMLLLRATRRARQRHEGLETLEAALVAGEGVRGWASRAVAEGGPEDTAEAAESVLAELIGLIARFLGADMAIRLVRQAFPPIHMEGLESGPEESNDE